MTIKVGDRLPDAKVVVTQHVADPNACAIPQPVTTTTLFKGKTAVLVSVPGAFTPTCHLQHIPAFIDKFDTFKQKGVDAIYVMSTNDIFVLNAWNHQMKGTAKIEMLADGNADFAKLLGLELDLTAKGMGIRSKRFALVAKDGVVTQLGIGELDVSGADAVLAKL